MKTFYLAMMLLVLTATQAIATTCVGDVTISSQAEADAFSCSEVTGNLLITGNDITNLNGLSGLTKVGGKLMIKNNPVLVDIKPLTSLVSVQSLIVVNNGILRNLNGLFNLDTITHNLSIKNNPDLINFTGLGKVRKVKNLELSGNPSLLNVDGLEKLEQAEVLLINNNVSMLNIDGLSSLLALTHMQITMTGNISMQNCCGLYNLWTSGTVYGAVDIQNNGAPCDRNTVTFNCDPNTVDCFATSVVSYNPGTTKDGRPIAFERSFPMKAVGTPQENDNYNFVALGFGGSITLQFGADIYDDGSAEPEFILVETSYGLASTRCFEGGQFNNPESAFIQLSDDGQTWYALPNMQCRTSFIDIKPAVDDGMPFARFIRITDTSNPFYFVGESDGFDVDGVIICEDEVLAGLDRLTNARTYNDGSTSTTLYNPDFVNTVPDEVSRLDDFEIYPNPVEKDDRLTIRFKSKTRGKGDVKIYDNLGRLVYTKSFQSNEGNMSILLDLSSVPQGQYILTLERGEQRLVSKLVK